ncbi:maleylpyruvate isomerase N-terminal domain-containing protein [Nitriliruptor alkaliphilus]|uniref:maleylpyruvate isomerase N-terminal domain-containing protein n=1 Tax=Nitriliruptor alkaliphilus TaxID=427918 RepID=UPI0012ED58DD|nr:maleylpyruvate isomerase N-terminal domain-containing protein [Nitriliruptor alkaliphilus]
MSELFLARARAAADLIGSDVVAERWDRPSALEGYTVAGLAGHLARAVLVVETYLDAAASTSASDPSAARVDASGYFTVVLADHDPVASDLHRGVRERGVSTAAEGPGALAAAVRACADRLATRLDADTLHQPLQVVNGVSVPLEQYLATRLVELVVHIDDLAVSVEVPADQSEDACRVVAGILAETAARRTGGIEAVRALARRERHPDALRAF